MTVFVVEDDQVILEGLTISLRQEGYEVLGASTYEDAFQILLSEKDFQICLLDVMLPDGDGLELGQ